MDSNTLRAQFLKFFEHHGHTIVPSASLVPATDPTLLFTNAGMVPFKGVFTGQEQRSFTRATSSQKCVRAGGKHNDLENVGYTARHHTFFEMLGNFSFGDYFKREAIQYAWEFITSPQWLGIDARRLLVTVYESDKEAYAIWSKEIGLPENRIIRIGDNKGEPYASDNFWSMGDTGPCGPCTEIFYDHDPDGSRHITGGPPGSADEEGDRWIEIWNVVFMQFERQRDGTLVDLPRPSVDTGMGLERISALMQGTHDNYRIDIFEHLIANVAKLVGQEPYQDASQKVIADHIRATAFLIADGVVPSNEGRGYVLRRIMRRAIRHGYKLGLDQPFFHALVGPLAEIMGNAYPELLEKRTTIERTIRAEEDGFALTLEKGMAVLDDAIRRLVDGVIPGDLVFRLYDTYGFPTDLTADIARERGLQLDVNGYEREMEAQRQRARAASQFHAATALAYSGDETRFIGYEYLGGPAHVLALYQDDRAVEVLEAGSRGIVILDRTPFYSESGGQVGDSGRLIGKEAIFAVDDTQTIRKGVYGHYGFLETGRLAVGDPITTEVTESRRRATARNHSATHLLHRALREVLGEHVSQRGSLVDDHRTRFDFSHGQSVSSAEIREVEDWVNRAILANAPVTAVQMNYADAIDAGAMALFGEKYGDQVRVLTMGTREKNYSTELCGGTHVMRTGDIGLFKILSETGVAAGIRRVEAVTGEIALAYLRQVEATLHEAAVLLHCQPNELEKKIIQLTERAQRQDQDIRQLKMRLVSSGGDDLISQAIAIGGIKVLVARVDEMSGGELRGLIDQFKQRLHSAVILLGSANERKVNLIAGVTLDLTSRVTATEVVNQAAARVGGKGGGRPDMAQAGGNCPEKLQEALDAARIWLAEHLR